MPKSVGRGVGNTPQGVKRGNVYVADAQILEASRRGVVPRRVHLLPRDNNDLLDPKNLQKAIEELCDLLKLEQENNAARKMCLLVLSQLLPKPTQKQILQNLYTVLRYEELKEEFLDQVEFKYSAKILFKYLIDFHQDYHASLLLYAAKLERLFEDTNNKNSFFEIVSKNAITFEGVLGCWAYQEKDPEYVICFLKITCELAAKVESIELAANIAEEAIRNIKIQDLFRHTEFIQVLKNLFAQGSAFSSVKRLLLGQILNEPRLYEIFDGDTKRENEHFESIKEPYEFFQEQLSLLCNGDITCFEVPKLLKSDQDAYLLFLAWCEQISQIWAIEKLDALYAEFLDQNPLEMNSQEVQTETIQAQKEEQRNNTVSCASHKTNKIIEGLEEQIESLKNQLASKVQGSPDVLAQQNQKFQKSLDKLKKEHQEALNKLRSKCEAAETDLKALELQLKYEGSRHQQECQSLLRVLGLEISNLEASEQLCPSSSEVKEVAQAQLIKDTQPQELAASVQSFFLEWGKAEKEALEKELWVTRTEKAAAEAAQACQKEIFSASLKSLESENEKLNKEFAMLNKKFAILKFGDPNGKLKDLGLTPEQISAARQKARSRYQLSFLGELAIKYPGKSIEEILDLEQKRV